MFTQCCHSDRLLEALLEEGSAEDSYDKLRIWPFIRPRREGLAIHDTVREMINEALHVRTPARFLALHRQAADYYKKRLQQATFKDNHRLTLERLYHLIQAKKEDSAIEESLAIIDTAVRFYQRSIVESILSLLEAHLKDPQSRYWLLYFNRLNVKFQPNIHKRVGYIRKLDSLLEKPDLDPQLRALSSISLGEVPIEANIAVDRRIELLNSAIQTNVLSVRAKAAAYSKLGYLHRNQLEWDKSIASYQTAITLCQSQDTVFEKVKALDGLSYVHLVRGDWNAALTTAKEAEFFARSVGGHILAMVLKMLGWIHTYKGELNVALTITNEALEFVKEGHDETNIIRINRRLAEIYDRQKRWSLSVPLYQELLQRDERYERLVSKATTQTLLGISYLKQGLVDQAQPLLLASRTYIETAMEPILLNAIGELYLKLDQPKKALYYFRRGVHRSVDRPYYLAKAYLGLILTIEANSSLCTEVVEKVRMVEDISGTYLYHDLLAILNLIQGHLTWEGHVTKWGAGYNTAMKFYRRSLLHALCYNRYLFDDLLMKSIEAD